MIYDKDKSLTNWDYYGLILFSLVSYVFSNMVKNTLEHGLQPGYPLDILGINLLSQIVLSFTRYGWYIYLIVPSYIFYKIFQFGWGWIANRSTYDTDDRPIDPKEAKRLAKKERKEERGRVKYIRK